MVLDAVTAPEAFHTSRSMGVEVRNIDASRPLSEIVVNALIDFLNKYSVIYLRGQKLTDHQFGDFSARFGKLKVSNLGRYLVPGFPELNIVSNIQENGQYIGNPDAGVLWHSDSAYTQVPDMYTFLYSIEVPKKDGISLGCTSFANTAAAYEALSPELKEKLAGLKAVQDLRSQEKRKKEVGIHRRGEISAHQEKIGLSAMHPVVRIHPVARKKCLYVSEGHTSQILGMSADESNELLTLLNKHIAQPQFVYQHQWEIGDILIWDNVSTVHRADFDYALPQRRLMHRTTTIGTPPC